MPDYRDFNRIERITRIEGALVNETPLRVGTGGEPLIGAPVDIAVYRIDDIPVIPGSSLKGVFRAYIESIAPTLGFRDVHSPWDHERIEEEAGERGGKVDFCPICGIFGNTKLASHVKVYDAYPRDPEEAKRSFIKTGIGIDRVFGAVRPGIGPFKEEFLRPGLEWDFKMDVINIQLYPKPGDLRGEMLRTLLNTLSDIGLQVGARKSVGAGLMRLREGRWILYTIREGRIERTEEGSLQ